jgi:putative PIN family toxin of toxin-antitoxin system
MYKVVLDTNVVVSALWSEQGKPYRILEMLIIGEIEPYYNDEILEEYNEVLRRGKLGFSGEKVERLLSAIIETGISADALKSVVALIDEDDRKFYDIAKANGAILITGNKKHYPDESTILSPAEFLEKLAD